MPAFQTGRFAYTVPEGFDPPGIGQAGLEEVDAAARTLKYPFYVVVAKELLEPGDAGAARAIDAIAEAWSSARGYDTGTSSIFLLSYNPRKWRFLAGARWRTDLGFSGDAHAPYTAFFVRAVSGTPKDPRGGIIRTMKAVDAYLWSMTDPEQVAARRRKDEEAAASERLRLARVELDRTSVRLRDLLQERDLEPGDLATYAPQLAAAEQEARSSDVTSVVRRSAELATAGDQLAQVVAKRHGEARARTLARWAADVAMAVAVGILVVMGIRRRRRYLNLKWAFEGEASGWEQKIENASNQYASIYLERDDLFGLDKAAGATKALYTSITEAIDDLCLSIRAMESHVRHCREMAGRASWLTLTRLARARAALDGAFEFDTDKVNQGDLFGKPTKVIVVNLRRFAAEQADRFKRAQTDWEQLKAAARFWCTPVESVLSNATLKDLQVLAKGYLGRWLSEHPLRDYEAVCRRLNETRVGDPLAAMAEVTSLAAKAGRIEATFVRVLEGLGKIEEAKAQKLPATGDTVFDVDDDPKRALQVAIESENKVEGLIACAPPEASDVVLQAIDKTIELYLAAMLQAGKIATATAHSNESIAEARALVRAAAEEFAAMRSLAAGAGSAHDAASLRPVVEAVGECSGHLARANDVLKTAEAALAARRHLDAYESAEVVIQHAEAAARANASVKQLCAGLGRQKTEFEARIREIDARYEQHRARFRKYGGDEFPALYVAPDTSAPRNYGLLLTELELRESLWQSKVSHAERAYREAAELNASRAAEAVERTRWHDDSFTPTFDSGSPSGSAGSGSSVPSSSGGNWDGGSGSSSGGNW